MHLRMRLVAAGLALLLPAAEAAAQDGIDPARFSTEMAERIAAASGTRVAVTSPLELRGDTAGGGDPAQIFLDRIYQYCRRNSVEACESTKERFAASTAESLAGMPPLTRERLRIVVRDAGYCAGIAGMLDKPEHAPVIRPVAPGLCAVLVADYPHTRAVVNQEGLDKLKLPAAAAWLSGSERTRTENAGMLEQLDLDANAAMLTGGDYLPSVVLDIEGWRRLAARTHGTVMMAVPGDEGVFVNRLDRAGDLAALRKLVRDEYAASERGISPLIYRWSGDGWVPVE
jgi:hypothetical protein